MTKPDSTRSETIRCVARSVIPTVLATSRSRTVRAALQAQQHLGMTREEVPAIRFRT